MAYNKSVDFLEMIKNGAPSSKPTQKKDEAEKPSARIKVQPKPAESASSVEETQKEPWYLKQPDASLKRSISRHTAESTIAVIDTETNWDDKVMSIGVVLADAKTYKCVGARYYILDPEYKRGGMYSNVINIVKSIPKQVTSRKNAMEDIDKWLKETGTSAIFAYNAKFDHRHMKEIAHYDWYDIMRLAAYKQFNPTLPQNAQYCKTGRLKSGYRVELILRMLSGDSVYRETHNAVLDAMDELKIMELLGHELDIYEVSKL